MTTDTPIPAAYIEFCKKVAALAAEARLSNLTMKIRPGFDDPRWPSDIGMVWDEGRHGNRANSLIISSEVTVRTTITTPPETQSP